MNKYELIEIDLTKVLNANKEEKIRWSKIVVDQFYKIGFLEMVWTRFKPIVIRPHIHWLNIYHHISGDYGPYFWPSIKYFPWAGPFVCPPLSDHPGTASDSIPDVSQSKVLTQNLIWKWGFKRLKKLFLFELKIWPVSVSFYAII